MGRPTPSGALGVAASTGVWGMLARLSRERSSASAAVVQIFAVRIALIVVTFGTGIIVARTLEPLGRGEQAALGLWPVLLCGLATFGIPMAVGYQTRRNPRGAGRLYFVALVLALAVGLLVSAAGIFLMPLLLRGYPGSLVTDARWLMLFAPQILVQSVVRAHLEARGEFVRSMLGQLMSTSMTLFALIALRLSGILTPATAALCYYFPSAIWTVWQLIRLWPRMVTGMRVFVPDAQALIAYGIRSYGTDLINTLSSQADLAVIVAFLNPLDLGLYSVALTISRLLNIVQQSLVTVMFPHASGLDSESAIEIVGRGARLSTIVSLILGLSLLAVVPLALPAVYGHAFVAALPIMPLLTGEAILGGLAYVLTQAFLTTGRPATVTFIQGGWLLSAVGLLLVLVPRMQLSGAAAALFGASVLRIGFVAVAYRLVLGRGLPRMIPDAADVAYVQAKFGAWRTPAERTVAP